VLSEKKKSTFSYTTFHYIVKTVKKSWETMPAKHLHKETMQSNGSTIMLDKKRFHVWIHSYEDE